MKNVCTSLLFGMLVSLSFSGCKKSSGATVEPKVEQARTFIPARQANQMIKSYLASIGYPEKDNQIRYWVLNADSLRVYLQDPTIKNIKVSLAHRMDYVSDGSTDIIMPETIILTGVDRENNYVTFSGDVMDNAVPCPRSCSLKLEEAIPEQ